jgi:hypothetical protein
VTPKQEHQRAIFEAFLRTAPDFAGEPLATWWQPEDEGEFPDIQGKSMSGKRVGVELGEWLNQAEMQDAKAKDRLEESILEAIGEQGNNTTEHVYHVWLHPKPKARIRPADASVFREQLFTCIKASDPRWPQERFWHSPQGHQLVNKELAAYPLLAKYLNAVKMWPKRNVLTGEIKQWPDGIDWIGFPSRGGPFSKETMLEPLRQLLSDKINHYAADSLGFDDLSLLVSYNLAWLYNPPAETPLHSFEDAVTEMSRFLDGDFGPFHRIFLFIATNPGRVLPISHVPQAAS